MEIQFSENSRGGQDQFYFRKISRIPENIDIALCELTVSASLRAVCTPDTADLEGFEGGRQLICMICIISGKRKCQVISQSAVCDGVFRSRLREIQLLSSL